MMSLTLAVLGSPESYITRSPIVQSLFAIIMDALSMLIHKRIEEEVMRGNIFEYHWRCKKTKLSHLCFADDLMLFCGGSLSSAELLHRALQEFCSLSGLLPNKEKSTIFIAGYNQRYIEAVGGIFQFPVDRKSVV